MDYYFFSKWSNFIGEKFLWQLVREQTITLTILYCNFCENIYGEF